jgi:DNA-binding MarR family transcriptional regulator
MKNNFIEEILEIMPSLPRILRLNLERDVFKPPLHSFHKGLAPHHMAIMKFVQIEGRPYVGDICEFSKISKAQMTNSIDKLLSLGMVIREPDPNDRRKISISLTEKGKSTIDNLDSIIHDRMRDKLSQLSDDDLKKLAEALKYLVTTLEKLI